MKTITLYTISSLLLATFALVSVSCGGVAKVREAAARQQKQNDFKQIGLSYIIYCDQNKKGPANADDLLKVTPEASVPLQKVKDGEYKIIWGVNVTDVEQFKTTPTFATILGYETTTPSQG